MVVAQDGSLGSQVVVVVVVLVVVVEVVVVVVSQFDSLSQHVP